MVLMNDICPCDDTAFLRETSFWLGPVSNHSLWLGQKVSQCLHSWFVYEGPYLVMFTSTHDLSFPVLRSALKSSSRTTANPPIPFRLHPDIFRKRFYFRKCKHSLYCYYFHEPSRRVGVSTRRRILRPLERGISRHPQVPVPTFPEVFTIRHS